MLLLEISQPKKETFQAGCVSVRRGVFVLLSGRLKTHKSTIKNEECSYDSDKWLVYDCVRPRMPLKAGLMWLVIVLTAANYV